MSNNPFTERLAEARAKALSSNSDTRLKSDIAINDALKRESVKTLTVLLNRIYEDLDMDTEKLANKIKMARRSPYGRISEMITTIASTYAWPVSDASQAKEIPELQERMLDTMAELGVVVDADLLLDIKEAKGYPSFFDQTTFTTVDGVEPMFEELEYYLLTFAESASLPIIDYKMSESVYDKLEAKAQSNIQAELDAADEALARHKEMTKEAVA